jgi:hypothetical protein
LATATPGICGDFLIVLLQMFTPLRLLQISSPAGMRSGMPGVHVFWKSLVVGNLPAFTSGSFLTRVLDRSDESPSGSGMALGHQFRRLTSADTSPERSNLAPKPTISSWGSRREETPESETQREFHFSVRRLAYKIVPEIQNVNSES